ncbi:hypothetical protein EMPS_00399 [Entomortierella parvispora]|uniref:Crinkler effector protein N-terminal domain-containing protein n=1 Tax=Entomortierella parvispora TaxID=205924 RepID=A0A9P3H1K8_9FUNG|nr:hypothetical protein EMPS_00399 [Entomortierella parvispora]
MTEKLLRPFCVVDKETANPFSVDAHSSETVHDLKRAIKVEISDTLKGVEARDLTLWSVSIPFHGDKMNIDIGNMLETDKEQLKATTKLYKIFGTELAEDTIHVIVQPPQSANPDIYPIVQERAHLLPAQSLIASDNISLKRLASDELEDLPKAKKIRTTEDWKQFTASDGKVVDLPPSWIDYLKGVGLQPDAREVFKNRLKDNLQAGDVINMPSLGQFPKEFGRHCQGRQLFVTEQMLELWKDMRGDQLWTYRRVLSGPMGVGKSYLSYFLAARAYAEGWLVLYISDAGVLNTKSEDLSTLQIVKRFLAFNKDILTGAELEMLVNDYDGSDAVSTIAAYKIFRYLLMSRDRKTLLLVDEHGKLFKEEPYVPDRFKSLQHLSSYGMWGEDCKGSHLIFSGTAYSKYEMEIMEDGYRENAVVFVGPLSTNVFSKLLESYPRLSTQAIKEKVIEFTNCVPRELVRLSVFVKDLPDPISVDDLQRWMNRRTTEFYLTANKYYTSRSQYSKELFYRALLQTFLGSISAVDFEWDFVDLGLIYRSKDVTMNNTQHHILCRPAQHALLELFNGLPLSEETKKRIVGHSIDGDDFEKALWQQLIYTPKPIMLHATDLNNKNPTTVSLDFIHHDTLRDRQISLGSGHESVLTRGYKTYPRFDLMLGPMFIQVSVSDFGAHNDGSVDIRHAFDDRDKKGTNQIERYLDDLYGAGHSASMALVTRPVWRTASLW